MAILILKRGGVFFREYVNLDLKTRWCILQGICKDAAEFHRCPPLRLKLLGRNEGCFYSYTHHDYECQTELDCKHDICRALHGTLVELF